MTSKKINVTAVCLFYSALFILADWIDEFAGIFHFPPKEQLNLERFSREIGVGLAIGLAVVLVSAMLQRFIAAYRELSSLLKEMLGDLSLQETFFISVFSSVGEEFFFRGVLQHYLGLVGTSLVFGLIHTGPQKRFLIWTAFALVMGFVLGATYELTGNLLVPVATHFIVNFLNIRMLMKTASAKA